MKKFVLVHSSKDRPWKIKIGILVKMQRELYYWLMSTHDLQVSLISLPLLKLTVSFRRWDAKKKNPYSGSLKTITMITYMYLSLR